MVGRKNA